MDAEAGKDQAPKTFTAKAAEVLLEHVAKYNCQAFDAVGIGRDLRFQAEDLLGQGLRVEQHLLHISVFPPATDRSRGALFGHHVQPPSRRR